MLYLLYVIALPAIVLNYISKWIFHVHGYAVTFYQRVKPVYDRGDKILPNVVVDGKPVFDIDDPKSRGYEYAVLRKRLLLDFIQENKLDLLVIFGCAHGRELYPAATALSGCNSKVRLVGADLSQEAIDRCRSYNLPNADFHRVDMEDRSELVTLLNGLAGGGGGEDRDLHVRNCSLHTAA